MISLCSRLRRKVLTFFYVNRSARVYVRQLAVALDVDSSNLSRYCPPRPGRLPPL